MDVLLTRFLEAQTQLVTQTADLPLGTLADMVDTGGIDLEPAFQRRERWSPDRQAALIESFLLNVPVPPVYLAEETNGTYTAIDGKQRLRAICDFMKDRFKLKNLDRMTEAEGLSFTVLPLEMQRALRLRPYIRVVTLLRQTNIDLKYEVFLRLNRGGESLNDQEIRNVAFRGRLNDTIYELAKSDFLRKQLKIESNRSSAYTKMEDAEYVLRFMALVSNLDHFSGKLAHAMDNFMKDRQTKSKEIIQDYKNLFIKSLSRCETFWGRHAFQRPEGDSWRSQFLAGMYDAQMLAVAKLDYQAVSVLSDRADSVLERTRSLFLDEKFEEAVRSGTNTPQRIRYRVKKVHDLLAEIASE